MASVDLLLETEGERSSAREERDAGYALHDSIPLILCRRLLV